MSMGWSLEVQEGARGPGLKKKMLELNAVSKSPGEWWEEGSGRLAVGGRRGEATAERDCTEC